MVEVGEISVGINFSSSEVRCLRTDCIHNLIKVKEEVSCNLKVLDIGEDGACQMFSPRDEQ